MLKLRRNSKLNSLAAAVCALLLAILPAARAEQEPDAGGGQAAAQETPAPYELPACIPLSEFAAPEPGSAFSVEGDMGIAVGDNWYPVLRDFSPLKEALGEPLDTVLTDSLIHPDYYDKEYVYEFGSVYTHPVDGVDVWYEIYMYDAGLPTSRGIQVGNTPDEVLAAYGSEHFTETNTIWIYSLSGTEEDYATPMITIESINDGVIYVDIYYPVFESMEDYDGPDSII